ncbi:MAG: molybdopterin biosynthesis protein [Deltaproteobacteria bacterium RBG_13_43_22]|nr:MAG: molybdopterin biosynthesis protein [Deltaproteobacteria bacterium RBG_13_43_22]
MKRKIYLQMKPLQEAREIFLNCLDYERMLTGERISTSDGLGRILAEPVFARFSSPNFHAAAMDGIALLAEDTFGTTVDQPKQFRIGKKAFWINTGQPMPEGTNAVIMVEQVNMIEEDLAEIEAAAFPWQYVRKMGEDLVATELLLPQGHRITAYDLGALIAGGIFQIPVIQRPRVVLIPTGSELIDWEGSAINTLPPGKVPEYNTLILSGLVHECGGEPVRWPIIRDKKELIREALTKAVASDGQMVIINAGSSSGSEDYSLSAMESLGEVLVHGVTIMPGKPTILGIIQGKPVIGNPGYPVSATISFEQFARPVLYKMQGILAPDRKKVPVFPARSFPSKLGQEEFLRVNLGRVGEKIIANPLPRGAGTITSLTKADGIIRIPINSEGINMEEPVQAELLGEESVLSRTVVIVGSHDNTLDLLGNFLTKHYSEFRLTSSNVGSTGGLMALKRGIAHLAGSHLLDPETGGYNITYIRRLIPEVPVKGVNLVLRQQGLILAKGNPKKITGLEDLVRKDLTFINRQAGSGTRILLDFRLKELGLDSALIHGYEEEEFTHMAVAVAVLSGRADVGLGIYAAARALDLNFIPVVQEEYDLVIPEKYWEEEKIKALLSVIRSADFQEAVKALGGYDLSLTGKVVF